MTTRETSEHTTRETTASEKFAALSADAVNALCDQCSDITVLIAQAEDVEGLMAAERVFRLVLPLWHAVGYGYKAPEVRARLVRRAAAMAAEERDFAAGERKGTRLRNKSLTHADNLDRFAANL